VAFALTLRSEDKTLEEPDILRAMEKVLNKLETEFGAQIRK